MMTMFEIKQIPGAAVRFIGAIALMATLGACRDIDGTSPNMVTGSGLFKNTAAEKFPIKVKSQDLSFNMPVSGGAEGMTSRTKTQLDAYLHYYYSQASGRLNVSVPRGSANSASVQRAVNTIKSQAASFAIGPDNLIFDNYSANGNPNPTIAMSFKRKIAVSKRCEVLNRNLAREYKDLNNTNVGAGCVQQHNLAAMIADPQDLRGAAGWSPRNPNRRDSVLNKYITGGDTAAQRGTNQKITTE